MQFRKILSAAAVTVALTATTSIAHAASFSSVIVYGDSLSDNGNLYSYIAYPPSPPYYNGRFSNGPVAVEQLATMLGVPLHDFAVGGATSGVGNYVDNGTQTSTGIYGLPGMQSELASTSPFLSALGVSSSLVVVWGGANDFLTGGSPFTAAANIDAMVAALQGDGAKTILVPGMPDLGLTPFFYGSAVATGYAQAFNAALLAGLPSGAIYYDTFGLLHTIDSNPGAYGFTDTTDACFNNTATPPTLCSDPSNYLFWDTFHPSTKADTIVAQSFESVVPEPSSLLLMATGLSGLSFLVRRRGTA
jgi:phospholipase/lecithinase/hemolysin